MMENNIYYPILVLLLFVAEEIYFMIAQRCRIVDRPIERSSHKKETICGGGIVFWIAVSFYMLTHGGAWHEYGLFFAGLTLIGGISFVDDVREVGLMPRLAIHFVSILLLAFELGIATNAPWWQLPVFVIIAVGCVNAYNFMDGVNGMTAAYSFVVLAVLAYINQYVLPEPFVSATLLHSVTFAVLVFGFYNFRTSPRCFAGDVGAISMAFIVVFLLGKLIYETGNYSYMALLAVYGVDSVMTIVHRMVRRENITQAHRKHLYQILANERGWKHTSVSLTYAVLQAGIAVGLLVVPSGWSYGYFVAVLAVLCVVYERGIKNKS